MLSAILIRHSVVSLAREPGPVLSRIGMPLVLITALRPLYKAALGPGGSAQAVTGMLVLFSMLGCPSSAAASSPNGPGTPWTGCAQPPGASSRPGGSSTTSESRTMSGRGDVVYTQLVGYE